MLDFQQLTGGTLPAYCRPQGDSPMTAQAQTTLIRSIREGLQQLVEAIPHNATAAALSASVGGDQRGAQARRLRVQRRTYSPRLVYRVTSKRMPKRKPFKGSML